MSCGVLPCCARGAIVLISGRVGSLLCRDSAQSAGLPYESLKGHSFRIGVASAAAAAGLPDWLIKVLLVIRLLPDLYTYSRISVTIGCS